MWKLKFLCWLWLCSVEKVFINMKLHQRKWKKCVTYPQEDCLFIKLITSFRISLLNNCKKDFQFHIKTTESKLFYTKYKFLFYTTYLNFTFLSSHDSRLQFRPYKVYFLVVKVVWLLILLSRIRFPSVADQNHFYLDFSTGVLSASASRV
jgi:hypothetical protein